MKLIQKVLTFVAAIGIASTMSLSFTEYANAGRQKSKGIEKERKAASLQSRSYRGGQISTMPVPLPGPRQIQLKSPGTKPMEKIGATPISIP